MGSLRLEIQHDMKMMKTDIEEVRRSVNRPWEETEEMKSLMSKQREDVDVMKVEVLLLKGQVKKERDRNTRLEQYSRRENIRLLNVKETDDENTEALSKKILTEMGVNVDGLRFHAVHRVGPVREAKQSLITEKRKNSQAYHSEVSLSTRQKYGLGKSRQDKRGGKLQGGIFCP